MRTGEDAKDKTHDKTVEIERNLAKKEPDEVKEKGFIEASKDNIISGYNNTKEYISDKLGYNDKTDNSKQH